DVDRRPVGVDLDAGLGVVVVLRQEVLLAQVVPHGVDLRVGEGPADVGRLVLAALLLARAAQGLGRGEPRHPPGFLHLGHRRVAAGRLEPSPAAMSPSIGGCDRSTSASTWASRPIWPLLTWFSLSIANRRPAGVPGRWWSRK